MTNDKKEKLLQPHLTQPSKSGLAAFNLCGLIHGNYFIFKDEHIVFNDCNGFFLSDFIIKSAQF